MFKGLCMSRSALFLKGYLVTNLMDSLLLYVQEFTLFTFQETLFKNSDAYLRSWTRLPYDLFHLVKPSKQSKSNIHFILYRFMLRCHKKMLFSELLMVIIRGGR